MWNFYTRNVQIVCSMSRLQLWLLTEIPRLVISEVTGFYDQMD
jgi:hypothetical protein